MRQIQGIRINWSYLGAWIFIDGAGKIPDCLRDLLSCIPIIVVRLTDRLGQRISVWYSFFDMFVFFLAGGEPKMPRILGLLGLMPRVRSISSIVGD